MSARSRERAGALLLLVLAAALLLLSAGRPWAQLVVPRSGLPAISAEATGADLAPLVSAAGLLGLAGVAALLVTRRWGRRLVGAILLLAGISVLITVRPAPTDVALGWAARRYGETATDPAVSTTVWPLLALIAGALLALAGGWVLVRAGRWSQPSRRYERAEAGVEDDGNGSNLATWQALDRGEDPSAPGS